MKYMPEFWLKVNKAEYFIWWEAELHSGSNTELNLDSDRPGERVTGTRVNKEFKSLTLAPSSDSTEKCKCERARGRD